MIELGTLKLGNYIKYKEAEFNFGYKGVTVIRGRNMNVRSKEATNGVGKSLLMSALPLLVYEQTPVSLSKQYSKKDMASKKTLISQTIGKYVIEKRGTEAKHRIYKNGKDLKYRTKSLAQEKISKILPLSEEEFYSTVYIDARRHQGFLLGTPSKRFEFFTSLFRLNSYDEIRKYFYKQAASIKDDGSLLTQMQQEVAALQYVKEVSVSKLQEKLNLLEVLMRNLSDKQKLLYKKIEKVEGTKERQRVIRIVAKKLTAVVEVLDKSQITLKEYPNFLAKLKSYAQQEREYKEYKTVVASVEQRQEKLLLRIRENPLYKKFKLSNKGLTALHEATEQQENLKIKLEERLAPIEEYVVEFSDIEELKTKKTYPKELLSKKEKSLFARIVSQEQTLKFLSKHSHKDAACPVCGSDVEDPKKLMRGIEDTLIELKQRRKKIQKYQERNERLQELERYEKAKGELKSLKRKLKEASEKTEYSLKDIVQYESWLKSYSEIETPKKEDKPFWKYNAQKLYEDLKEVDSLVKSNNIKDLEAYSKEDLEAKKESLEKVLKRVNAKVDKISSQMPELKAKITIIRDKKKELKEKEQQASDLEIKASDLPAYKLLVDAYSTTGLKLLMIRRIATMVERNLNTYSPLLFAETYRFKIEVGENTFSIFMYLDKEGKATEVREVRLLSGAESRIFMLLFLLSVLPLIPASRRVNALVLDEPEVNMDPATRQHFINNFIPSLSKIVPHIIICTPLMDAYSYAREIVVVKKGKTSHLESVKKL